MCKNMRSSALKNLFLMCALWICIGDHLLWLSHHMIQCPFGCHSMFWHQKGIDLINYDPACFPTGPAIINIWFSVCALYMVYVIDIDCNTEVFSVSYVVVWRIGVENNTCCESYDSGVNVSWLGATKISLRLSAIFLYWQFECCDDDVSHQLSFSVRNKLWDIAFAK